MIKEHKNKGKRSVCDMETVEGSENDPDVSAGQKRKWKQKMTIVDPKAAHKPWVSPDKLHPGNFVGVAFSPTPQYHSTGSQQKWLLPPQMNHLW